MFDACDAPNLGDQFWPSLDTELNRLVDRSRASGYQHTLEVEFQHNRYFVEKVTADLDRFLPRFREKGRVVISEILPRRVQSLRRVLYCSDG